MVLGKNRKITFFIFLSSKELLERESGNLYGLSDFFHSANGIGV